MSIKCSLLGHDFGETTVEREREEEGTEVVITITEMETCTRCGESRVVSENKEVTTLETPDDGGRAAGGSGPTSGGADETTASSDATDEFATTAGEGTDTADQTDAVILDDDSDVEAGAQAEARGGEPTIPDAESDAAAGSEPDDDDAVIIGDAEGDDETDTAEKSGGDTGAADVTETEPATGGDDTVGGEDDREPGEWPDEDTDPAERAGESDEVEILDDGPAPSTEDDADGGDSGDDESVVGSAFNDPASAVEADEGAEVATEQSSSTDEGGAADDDRTVGAWPDEEASGAGSDAMGEWPEETLRDEPAESDASEPSLERIEGHSITVPEGKFKCSECGFTTDVESSSLRAGDFCPECHRGTLLQHEGQASDES